MARNRRVEDSATGTTPAPLPSSQPERPGFFSRVKQNIGATGGLLTDVVRAPFRAATSITREIDAANAFQKETGRSPRDPKNRDEFNAYRESFPMIDPTKELGGGFDFAKKAPALFLGEEPVGTFRQSARATVEAVGRGVYGLEGDDLDAFVTKNQETTVGRAAEFLAISDLFLVGSLRSGAQKQTLKKVAETLGKDIARTTDVATIKTTLSAVGVADEVAETLAPSLAKNTDEAVVSRIVETAIDTSAQVRYIERGAANELIPQISRKGLTTTNGPVRDFVRRSGVKVSDEQLSAFVKQLDEKLPAGPGAVASATEELVERLRSAQLSRLSDDFLAKAITTRTKPRADLVDDILPDDGRRTRGTEALVRAVERSGDENAKRIVNEYGELVTRREILKEAIGVNPGKEFARFTSKKATVAAAGVKGLPEITGAGPSKFSREGDKLLERGRDQAPLTREEANEAIVQYENQKKELLQLDEQIVSKKAELRDYYALNKMSEDRLVAESIVRNREDLATAERELVDQVSGAWADIDPNVTLGPGIIDGTAMKAYSIYKGWFEKFIGRALTAVEESSHALKRFIEQNANNINLTNIEDPFVRQTRFYGMRSAKLEDVYLWEQDYVTSVSTFAKANNLPEEKVHTLIHDYMVARHIPERNAKLGKDAVGGISDDDARLMLETIEARPDFDRLKPLIDELAAFHKETLDVMRAGGLVSDETFALLKTTYKDHVPLNRIFDSDDMTTMLTGRGMNVKFSGLYKAKGSDRAVAGVLENIITARAQAINRAEKNLSNLNFVRFAKQNDTFITDEGAKLFRPINERSFLEMNEIDRQNVLEFFENGKKKYLHIDDPLLAAGVKADNRYSLGGSGLVNTLRLAMNMYGGLVTRYNVNFGLPNNIRDLQEAAVWLAGRGEHVVAQKLFKNTGRGTMKADTGHRAVLDFLLGKNTEGTKLYKQLREDGGTSGGMMMMSRDEVEEVSRALRSRSQSGVKKALNKVVKMVEGYNRVLEDSTRLNVYKAALDAGKSRADAAFLAKKATIDFDQMGTYGPVMNGIYLFSKVAAVGSIKAVRAMNPATKQGAKNLAMTTAAMGTAMATVYEMNDTVYPDWRDLVTEDDLESSLPLVIPSADGKPYVVKVPVAYALRPLKAIIDGSYLAIEQKGEGASIAKFSERVLSATLGSYNPLGGATLVQSLTPTVLDVPVDIFSNTSWSGRTIYPDYNRDLPMHLNYYPSQNDTAFGRSTVYASRRLYDTTGFELSPEALEYMFSQYTGGPGRTIQNVVDSISGAATDGAPGLQNIPILNAFLSKRDPDEYLSGSQIYAFANLVAESKATDLFYRKEAAEEYLARLRTLAPEEKKREWSKLVANDKVLAREVKKISEEEKLGFTAKDRKIASLSVKNGDRARVLYAELRNVDKEVAREKWQDYVQKGVITPTVAKQLKKLLKERPPLNEILTPREKNNATKKEYNEIQIDTAIEFDETATMTGALVGGSVIAGQPKRARIKAPKGKAALVVAAVALLPRVAQLAADMLAEEKEQPLESADRGGREVQIEVIKEAQANEGGEAAEAKPQVVITKDNLVFQESGVNSGIPYVETDAGRKRIDEIDFRPPVTRPIKRIKINDPREGHSFTVDQPEQLEVANQIKAISDAVAPEYTDYLLRLARYEGVYNVKQRNVNRKDGSVDRGIFQINNKYFPEVTDEMADDLTFATLWAIAAIEAGKQNRWVADRYVKKATTAIEYEE